MAADGEDRRGRVFGFGKKSRTYKVNQVLVADDASMSDPAKSTATSAEEETQTFTKSQVAVLIGSKIVAERRAFAKELAAQEERHRAEFDEVKKTTEYNKTCLAALYKLSGAPMPAPNVSSMKHYSANVYLYTTMEFMLNNCSL
jgi:hypothetical protein